MTGPSWEQEDPSWRGDQHPNLAEQEGSEERWRGGQHLDDWPKEQAGPEYGLNKKQLEEDDDGA